MSDVATANYENMGPTLLAQMKVSTSTRPQDEQAGWQTLYNHLEARFQMLRNWRYSWWIYWRVLAEFFLPRRYIWLVVANKMWRGHPINDAIIDSTGALAVRTCASGMWSGLTNPARPWIKLDRALPWIELDADGKAWYEDTADRVYTVLAQSNFYTEMAQGFQDLTVFGTAVPIIYEDSEDVARVYLPAAGEYYLACGARLEVDTVNREFTYTVLEIVEFAGFDNCPANIQKLYLEGGGSLDVEFVVCHSIEPNFPITKKGKGSGDSVMRVLPEVFTWREVYWIKGTKSSKPLVKRGFLDKPFFPMRWSKVSNDAYGRSPCMDALGDDKQVQLQTRRTAEYTEKGVRPPMGADAELKNEPASIMPAHITYMSTGGGQNKKFWPLFEVAPQWVAVLTEQMKTVNERIEKCLFVDVFMAITQMQGVQPRNELELTKRDLERLQALGPVIELVEGELKMMIRRVLSILERRRMLKPIPASLKGVPLKIEFTSIMRLAQRSALSVSMKDTFATLGELSSAAKAAGLPDPLRGLKLDEAARKYAEVNNFPSDLWWTPQEVLQHDQARAKAMSQQQAPGNAMAAVSAAKTLAETPMGGNTALAALTGQQGGGAGIPA